MRPEKTCAAHYTYPGLGAASPQLQPHNLHRPSIIAAGCHARPYERCCTCEPTERVLDTSSSAPLWGWGRRTRPPGRPRGGCRRTGGRMTRTNGRPGRRPSCGEPDRVQGSVQAPDRGPTPQTWPPHKPANAGTPTTSCTVRWDNTKDPDKFQVLTRK